MKIMHPAPIPFQACQAKPVDLSIDCTDCIDCVTEIGNLHMRNTGTPCYGYRPSEGRRKSVDLALLTSVLGVKTLHSMAEVPDINYDKGIGGESCARNNCRCMRAGEIPSANGLNGRFQSRLRSLYIRYVTIPRKLRI